jgi:hypothetical protein
MPTDEHDPHGKMNAPQAGVRRLRPWIVVVSALVAVAALACWSIVSKGSSAPAPAAPVVRGELISPLAPTNASPATNALTAPPSKTKQPAVAVAAPLTEPVEVSGDFISTGFDKLAAFPIRVLFKMTNPITFASTPILSGPIPDAIMSFDEKKIAMQGYMLPMKLEDGRVRDFLLMRSRMFCCFGKPLALNEWVTVHMVDSPVKSIMDQPITVYGRLHVGPVKENGQISTIYRLDGARLDGPESVR